MQTRGSESTELKFNKLTIYSLKLNPIQKPKSTHDKKLWLRGLFVFRSLQNADGTEPRGQARGAAPLGRTLGHDASPVRIFRFFESSLFPLTFRTETVETVSLVSHACLLFRCCVQSTFETTFGTRAELGGSGWRRRTKKPRAQRLMISAAWSHGQVTDRSRTGHRLTVCLVSLQIAVSAPCAPSAEGFVGASTAGRKPAIPPRAPGCCGWLFFPGDGFASRLCEAFGLPQML